MPQLKTCLAASLLGAMALLAGCRSVPTNEDLSAISTETLDYRNGWFHWASGTETVRSIAETYRRDPLLVAELNRSQQDSIPEAGKAIYVPPIHDRAKLKEILTRIGEHPETVPTIPPKPEMLGIAPKEAAAAPAEAAPVQSPQPVPDEKPATPQPPTPETPAAEPPPAPPPVTTSEAAPVPVAAEGTPFQPPKHWSLFGGSKKTLVVLGVLPSDPISFAWPVRGRVIQPFSQAQDTSFKGVVIEAAENAPIQAARDGEVIYAGELNGYGKVIILQHGDGFLSVYGYNQELKVGNHDHVLAGQEIALAGRPSATSSSQLFFQIRKNARPVDPTRYLPAVK